MILRSHLSTQIVNQTNLEIKSLHFLSPSFMCLCSAAYSARLGLKVGNSSYYYASLSLVKSPLVHIQCEGKATLIEAGENKLILFNICLKT